jgi:hypothetical protein
MTTLKFLIPLLALAVIACPLREADHPTRDDTNEPADGDTGGELCEDEQAKIKALEAELAECQAPK